MLNMSAIVTRDGAGVMVSLEFSKQLTKEALLAIDESVHRTSPNAQMVQLNPNSVEIKDDDLSFDEIVKECSEIEEPLFGLKVIIEKDALMAEGQFPMTMEQFAEHIRPGVWLPR